MGEQLRCFRNIFLGLYGIMGWTFLTLFVWSAFLRGGKEGYVLLAFNLYGEMILELFLITGILVLMVISMCYILKEEMEAKE